MRATCDVVFVIWYPGGPPEIGLSGLQRSHDRTASLSHCHVTGSPTCPLNRNTRRPSLTLLAKGIQI